MSILEVEALTCQYRGRASNAATVCPKKFQQRPTIAELAAVTDNDKQKRSVFLANTGSIRKMIPHDAIVRNL